MTWYELCEHLERRCGVSSSATLRARVAAVSIDPTTLDWGCIDYELMSSVQGNGGSTGGEVFHLDLMKTKFYGKNFGNSKDEPQRIAGTVITTNPSSFEPNCIDDDEATMDGHATMDGPPLTAEQESLEAES
jgi:hypothetical protein